MDPAPAIEDFVPRYFEIEQALRLRIAALEAGSPLPSDAQLCQEFGVSRMTARSAVQRLVQEGLAHRIPGRGTFAAEGRARRHASGCRSFSEEMRRHGLTPSSRVLELSLHPADAHQARRLSVKWGSEVVVVRRIRLGDARPLVLEHAVFALAVAAAVFGADLETDSLREVLVAGGFTPSAGRSTFEADMATACDARALDIPRGSPLLVERRLVGDQHGRPLELTESRYAQGQYGINIVHGFEEGELDANRHVRGRG